MTLENTTPVPNVCFDVWPHELTATEYQVAMYIVRRTVGFNKSSDFISWDQFLHGIVTSSGKRLDYGCGLTSRSILGKCLQSLIKKGKIQFKVVKRKIYYSPCFGSSVPEVVLKQPTETDTFSTESGTESVPKVVLSSVPKVVHTKDSNQKTVNKRKKDANASVSSSSLSTPETPTTKKTTRTRTSKYAFTVPKEMRDRVNNVYAWLDGWAQKNVKASFSFPRDEKSDQAICQLLEKAKPTERNLEKVCKTMWDVEWNRDKMTINSICNKYVAMLLTFSDQEMKRTTKPVSPFNIEEAEALMKIAQNTPSAITPARFRTKKRIEG